ncbi:hypothetical protein ACWEOS_17710 [Micromonospora taraxaci]|uniref:hypothetical protein n=1 Tax=Micromonospora taraxaci TaxID=1316803 RepID=UPI003C2E67D6
MDNVDQPARRPLWVDAAAIVAVVVTLILAARQLRPLVEAAAFLARTGETVVTLPTGTWLRAVAWVAVGIAIFARWRSAVVLGAWAAVLYEVAVLTTSFTGGRRSGATLDLELWPLLLALTAAALLSVASPLERGLDLLTRRGRTLLVAAASTATLTAATIPLLGEPSAPSQAGYAVPTIEPAFVVSSRLSAAVAALTFVVVLALAVAAVSDLGPAVRKRVLTLMGAGIAGYATIHLGLPRPFGVWDGQVLSAPAEAVLLVLAPGLVLGVGLYLIRASERAARPRVDNA